MTLRRWGLDDEGFVLLVLDELVTNALVHGWPPIHITLSHDGGGSLHISVSDGGEGIVTPQRVSDASPSGRGLTIVNRVARSWGVTIHQGDGKTVWADVPMGA